MPKIETKESRSLLRNLIASYKRSLLARKLSPHTVTSYLRIANLFAHFAEEEGLPGDPANLTREHVEYFLNWLYSTPSERTGRLPKAVSTRSWFASLQPFFKWLEDVDEIKQSPMRGLSPPRPHKSHRPVLTLEQVKRILKACEGTSFRARRDYAMMMLFIDTGLRLSEMAAITVDDIDWVQQAIIIHHGKGDKARVVYFGRKTAKALDQYAHLKGGRRDHKDHDVPQLWLGTRGALKTYGVSDALAARGKEAGVHLYPHLWRHFFIHASLKEGMHPGDLMRITGHTKLEMLLHYGEAAADERARESHRRLGPGDRL